MLFRGAWGIGGSGISVGIDDSAGTFQFPKRQETTATAGNADSNYHRVAVQSIPVDGRNAETELADSV